MTHSQIGIAQRHHLRWTRSAEWDLRGEVRPETPGLASLLRVSTSLAVELPGRSHSDGRRFAALDGLRIVGALAVLTTHAAFSSGDALFGPFAGLLSRLDAGVPLFFVVSGFLLYRPHVRVRLGTAGEREAGRTLDGRVYLRHRALRILPVLWLAVLAAVLLLPHPASVGAGDYVRIATLTQIYTDSPSVPGLTQMWSLATEVAFYLALPLLAWGLARVPGSAPVWTRRSAVLLALTPVVAVVWIVATHNAFGAAANLWLPAYLGWFGMGMLLALWHEARLSGAWPRTVLDDLGQAPGTVWAMAAALYLLLSTPVAGPYGLTSATTLEAVVKNVGYTLLGLLVVAPCVTAEATSSRVVRALGSRPAKALGDVSYGVFAYHLIVLGLVERAIGHQDFTGNLPILWPVTVLVSIPLAYASFRWIERPIMQWGRRRVGRARPQQAPAPAPATSSGRHRPGSTAAR